MSVLLLAAGVRCVSLFIRGIDFCSLFDTKSRENRLLLLLSNNCQLTFFSLPSIGLKSRIIAWIERPFTQIHLDFLLPANILSFPLFLSPRLINGR